MGEKILHFALRINLVLLTSFSSATNDTCKMSAPWFKNEFGAIDLLWFWNEWQTQNFCDLPQD